MFDISKLSVPDLNPEGVIQNFDLKKVEKYAAEKNPDLKAISEIVRFSCCI